MNKSPLLRRASVTGSIVWFVVHSAIANAGSMMLTFDGIATPIEVLSFKIGASIPIDLSSGGIGKVAYDGFSITALESDASPMELGLVNLGRHVRTAVLQVRSSDGTKLLSEWSFKEVLLDSFGVESGPLDPKAKAPNSFLPPLTSFSLRFDEVCYKVFAADGTVKTQICYNLKENKQV